MKNIIIFTAPRSGSGLLTKIISDAPNTINLAEFFSAGKTHVGKHLNNYIQYMNKDYIAGLEAYKPLMEKLAKLNTHNLSNRSEISQYLNTNILKLYLQFKGNPNFILKIFHSHYNGDNQIDIYQLVDMFDAMIILYRENLIEHYISFERAMKTKVWFRPNEKYQSNRIDFCQNNKGSKNRKKSYDNKTKIKWDKTKYIKYCNKLNKSYNNYNTIVNISCKPTIVIRYEDLNKQKNKYKYVQSILDYNNIDHKLIHSNEDPLVKQSVEGFPIEDNFLNKQQFIKEFMEDTDDIPKKLQFRL